MPSLTCVTWVWALTISMRGRAPGATSSSTVVWARSS